MRINRFFDTATIQDLEEVDLSYCGLLIGSNGIRHERNPLVTIEGEFLNNRSRIVPAKEHVAAVKEIEPTANAFLDLGLRRVESHDYLLKPGLLSDENELHATSFRRIHGIELYHLDE